VRERFPARMLTEADGDLWLVALRPLPPALHLTRQSTLDALGLDDRVNTGRIDPAGRADPDPLLLVCGALSDAVFDWWKGRPPPLVYRTRTMPTLGRSVAFGQWASPAVAARGRLRQATALHASLVLRAGFVVPDAWLG
jgi:hypothetical protein